MEQEHYRPFLRLALKLDLFGYPIALGFVTVVWLIGGNFYNELLALLISMGAAIVVTLAYGNLLRYFILRPAIAAVVDVDNKSSEALSNAKTTFLRFPYHEGVLAINRLVIGLSVMTLTLYYIDALTVQRLIFIYLALIYIGPLVFCFFYVQAEIEIQPFLEDTRLKAVLAPENGYRKIGILQKILFSFFALTNIPMSIFITFIVMIRFKLVMVNDIVVELSLICALVLLTLVVYTYYFAKTLYKNINNVVDNLRQISSGNLITEPVSLLSVDELGTITTCLNETNDKLRTIFSDVNLSVRSVAIGSQEMRATALGMSQGASEQAAATEGAAKSMEEMLANIRQNSDNAKQTELIAIKAAEHAKITGQTVEKAVQAMNEIAEKVMIIDDIAQETRMLSLNATIEASRAKEHGKGFAIVASEIRSLSERSKAAAFDISELATLSVTIAENATEQLYSLVPEIRQTTELVKKISAASKEQEQGSAHINSAIRELDIQTQQYASTSEEMSAMSEELANEAEELVNTISYFAKDD